MRFYATYPDIELLIATNARAPLKQMKLPPAIDYIHDMLHQLADMCADEEMQVLRFLLVMAAEEAFQEKEKLRKSSLAWSSKSSSEDAREH